MSNFLKDSIKENILISNKNESNNNKKNEDKQSKDIVIAKDTFKLEKKKDDKTNKKAFNVYMEETVVKEIDKAARKSGYSRNELINIMCQWCLENLEIKE